MARAGLAIEQQGTSSQFRFEDGYGEIVNAVFAVEQIEGYDAKCGMRVSIQRMSKDWKPTSDEPIDEFLGCGPVTKFHPGTAQDSDDEDPDDLGEEVGTEGNALFSVEGAKIDKKSKSAIFAASLQDLGFKPGLLNGYAPNLIGTRAYFYQLMLSKGADFTGKRDPTCLCVKEKLIAPGASTTSAGKTASAPAKKGPGPVAAPPIKKAAAAAVAEASEGAGDSGVSDEVESVAVGLLAQVPGKEDVTMTRTKIGSKLVTLLAKNRVATNLHKPVQEAIKNDAWFLPKAEEMGWTVEGADVTIPAA